MNPYIDEKTQTLQLKNGVFSIALLEQMAAEIGDEKVHGFLMVKYPDPHRPERTAETIADFGRQINRAFKEGRTLEVKEFDPSDVEKISAFDLFRFGPKKKLGDKNAG